MDIKDIRRIIEMMKESELTEFELEDEGFRIAIKRNNGASSQVASSHTGPGSSTISSASPPPDDAEGASHRIDATRLPPPEHEGLVRISSPMVGTFYRSSAPDSDPFVSVGSEIEEDTVVCIVEAMKVMNEIKAEIRGVIRKILVENAAPVQFGQPLLLVEPA
jgi:acetyl-CoA carboxylase biotin carboxyl carrier protein